jgi:hypothetical protein
MAKLAKLPPETGANLRSEGNQAGIRGGVILLVTLLAGAVIETASAIVAIGLTIGGVAVSFVYLLTALRASVLLRELPAETRRVAVVGWTRPPDGTNYAIWPAGADQGDEPEAVLGAGGARDVVSGGALLLVTTRLRRSAALIGPAGQVLGIGSLRSPARAAKVWTRRDEPSPRWAGFANRPNAADAPTMRKRR